MDTDMVLLAGIAIGIVIGAYIFKEPFRQWVNKLFSRKHKKSSDE